MANLEAPGHGTDTTSGTYVLNAGTLTAAAIAVCLAQVALAVPAVLNGPLQLDLGPTSAQLTWISDAFLIPVCLFELTFGVLGDLFRGGAPEHRVDSLSTVLRVFRFYR